jgi:hypothetical protein
MRLCERNNWTKPCPNICGEMCEVWNSDGCRFSESKRGWSCEQCWTHSIIPEAEIVSNGDVDECPVCGTSEFLGQPDDRFNVEAWCGGTGTKWTAEAVSPHG